MLRAAFGISMIDGSPQFSGAGQSWIKGSASKLQTAMSPPQEFLQRFPVLQIATNERPFPLWPNSQGAIYLRFSPSVTTGVQTPAVWDVVHVFQPKFSRQRTQPLHLFLRMESDAFRETMALSSAIAALDAARTLCDASPIGGAAWTAANAAALPPQPPETLQDLQMAAAIFGRLRGGDLILALLDDVAFWRGVQVLMQGLAAAGGNVLVAILLEDQASVPLAGGQKLLLTIGSYAKPADAILPLPLSFQGVKDTDLLAERIPPTEIVRGVWEAISQKKTGSFEELYSPALRLIPLSHVSDLEFPSWVREVCQSDHRTREVLTELIRQFSPGAPTEQQLKRLAHILVGANDVAGGNVVAASARLQEVLKVHRHTAC